jgi:hypothetical protein
MTDKAVFGWWERRFLVEHLVEEQKLAALASAPMLRRPEIGQDTSFIRVGGQIRFSVSATLTRR